jgi:hypothetical protein
MSPNGANGSTLSVMLPRAYPQPDHHPNVAQRISSVAHAFDRLGSPNPLLILATIG